ncbi:MAG: glycosyltransferase, partial [Wenzhouxiangellaceae bacterium]|nr:glycosyltransferase [Wenzhouxiangellaceae bacterium]
MPDPTAKPDQSQPDDADDAGMRARLASLQALVRNLETISKGVFASASWRVGQRVANLLRRIGMRVPVSTAEAEMQRLIGELKEIAGMPDLDRAPEPDDVVLGKLFRLSETTPRRFPGAPPGRPLHWNLVPDTLNKLAAQLKRWKYRPAISVVVPVHDTKREWLDALVESIQSQFYPHWQLVLVDDASTKPETREALDAAETEDRIRVVRREKSGGISMATNAGIGAAEGDYIAFVDHDDLLEPDALLQVARAIEATGADIVYTDEDKIDEAGEERYDPHYKPAWSPDLLLSQNYVSHLCVIRRELIGKVGGLNSEFDGSQDHDLLLRCSEGASEIVHVPLALYHWRAVEGSTAREFGEKSYPWEAGRRAVEKALARREIAGAVELGDRPGTYRVNREVIGSPKVSILIPFRDQPKLLEQCIRSILDKTEYEHYEIVGLDNQSTYSETRELMRKLAELDARVRFEAFDEPFNFSAINNFGATLAEGDHLLLLNNDTEVISPQWLGAMLAHSQRDEVGAVGAKLLYPDNRIQHAGAILGIGGVAGHSHKYLANESNGYFSRPHLTQNVSAVTGACLMVKKALYQELKGLEERYLAVAFNDIDFCIRLRDKGLLNIYEPAAVL